MCPGRLKYSIPLPTYAHRGQLRTPNATGRTMERDETATPQVGQAVSCSLRCSPHVEQRIYPRRSGLLKVDTRHYVFVPEKIQPFRRLLRPHEELEKSHELESQSGLELSRAPLRARQAQGQSSFPTSEQEVCT